MDYNTQRPQLQMSEYGRVIQKLVTHCVSIADRDERLRCAQGIIRIMAGMTEPTGDKEDFRTKLWNHLAAISNYELDIDYPVKIERRQDNTNREAIPYPQKKIARRHYGAIVEEFAHAIVNIEDRKKCETLGLLLANHMKRDLSNWSVDSMSDEKVISDIASYTDGKVSLDPHTTHLTSDGELLSTLISTSVKKKKKKKNK